MWNSAGLLLCFIVIVTSGLKSKHGKAGYYEREVYGMTARTHLAYLLLSIVFAALFAAAFFAGGIPVIPLLGAYALVFIFYFSSFARGFSDEE
jgi:membrane-bound ClpP family serine protease